MCRRNQLYGWILLSFGLGLLLGKCLEGGIIATFIGVAIVFAGLWVMRQK